MRVCGCGERENGAFEAAEINAACKILFAGPFTRRPALQDMPRRTERIRSRNVRPSFFRRLFPFSRPPERIDKEEPRAENEKVLKVKKKKKRNSRKKKKTYGKKVSGKMETENRCGEEHAAKIKAVFVCGKPRWKSFSCFFFSPLYYLFLYAIVVFVVLRV